MLCSASCFLPLPEAVTNGYMNVKRCSGFLEDKTSFSMKNIAKKNQSATGNTMTLPSRWYHDPAIYEAERKAVFFDEWLLFGHESRVREPGSYHAQNIAGWPVFVIRGKDGALRGFHNVCRHRASQVLREGCGKAGVLRCLYHGWVYDDQGNLRKTPGFGGDEAALCENTALFPV